MTRIIAGAFGGRRIAVPRNGTRPTTDRARESLFNVLSARMELTGAAVLDLYAGSGALGLEALSRGAVSALFVESDSRAAAVITQNITALGATGAVVRRGEVSAVLSAAADRTADLVLADPPYAVPQDEVSELLAAMVAHGWVADGSVVVLERPASGPAQPWPTGWTPWRERRYGDTRLEMAEVGRPND